MVNLIFVFANWVFVGDIIYVKCPFMSSLDLGMLLVVVGRQKYVTMLRESGTSKEQKSE